MHRFDITSYAKTAICDKKVMKNMNKTIWIEQFASAGLLSKLNLKLFQSNVCREGQLTVNISSTSLFYVFGI